MHRTTSPVTTRRPVKFAPPPTPEDTKMTRAPLPASFSAWFWASGLGQAWRIAARLWGMPALIGEGVLLLAGLVWLALLVSYVRQAVQHPAIARNEFLHPVQGSTPFLLAISTLLIVLAVEPYSRPLAWTLALAGISWHLAFSLWHTGSAVARRARCTRYRTNTLSANRCRKLHQRRCARRARPPGLGLAVSRSRNVFLAGPRIADHPAPVEP